MLIESLSSQMVVPLDFFNHTLFDLTVALPQTYLIILYLNVCLIASN